MSLTKIIQQNLKLYFSENNLDTEDGGGLRTGNELTGAVNELFPSLGDQSNAIGNFAMRLIYAGVDRDDDEPLLEAGFIVAEPPVNPNVSYIAFEAAYNGELRKNAVSRVKAHSIKTIESRMTLLSQQVKNSRLIMAYQAVDEEDPKVGEVYCLDQDEAGYDVIEEYVKIEKIETEVRSFFNSGTNKYFQRKVVKMEITNPLTNNFQGQDGVTESYYKPPCIIRETMVADAGKYYGVKKLAKSITAGESVIKVENIFDKIIPSSSIPTALSDLDAGSSVTSFVDAALSGEPGEIQVTNSASAAGVYRTGKSIMPGSCRIVLYGESYSDDGKGAVSNATNKLADVDYENGIITNTSSISGFSIYFRAAVRPRQIADTAAIAIDQTNQSKVYTITLSPPPLDGSAKVSYRSQNNWYDLDDDGTGVLTGAESSYGSATIDKITNTVAVTLGALPDVGSEVIFSWATPVSYFNRADATIDAPSFKFELNHTTITPNTVTVTYLDSGGTQQAATDDGSGTITGDGFTIKLDYAQGEGIISYLTLPNGGAQYQFDYSYGNQLTKGFPSPNRNSDGSISLDLEQTNIKPHSVKMIWNVDIETFDYLSTTPATMQVHGKIDPYITVFDDGNGNLKDAAGKSYGTINYATGIITFVPETTIKIPVGQYSVTHIGFDTDQPEDSDGWHPGDSYAGNKVYRNQFTGWDYVDAGVSMPLGTTGRVDVWFNAADAANNATVTATLDTLKVDVTPLYAENVVGGSMIFSMGGKTYTENNGTLYYDHDFSTGASVEAGTFNYAEGEASISAWTTGQSATVALKSLLTSIDKNPVDEVVFRVPKAPIQPRSLQLMATDLQGNNINVTVDGDGKLTGANIIGNVELSTGVVRCRFGEWVDAAGHENEIWYKEEAKVGTRIFKPAPVFADTIKYNAVSYTYLPLDKDIIGIDTVRFPSDGQVPIYRKGDLIVVAARYKQSLGTAFTAGQVLQMNVTNLTALCVIDANRKHLTADKYSTDLSAGTVTFANSLDLSDYELPLTAQYSVEETATVSNVDIAGYLTLVQPLQNNYDKAHTFVSSMLVGGTKQVRTTKPFTQATWDNVWSDERRGDEVLVKLDTKNHPIVLTDDSTITDQWVIVHTGGLNFDLYSRTIGHVISSDFLQDLAPINPASNSPYFVLPKEAFGPTDNPKFPVGYATRFNTYSTFMDVWIIRAGQPGSYNSTEIDGADLCLRGNTVKETTGV